MASEQEPERRCKACGVVKPASEFRQTGVRGRPYRLHTCRECHRAQRRQEYAANPIIARRTVIAQRRTQRINRERLRSYLASHPCVDCGESDLLVLDFDHVRGVKVEDITTLVKRKGWAKVEAEIAKCDVRCSNCHRRKTARQLRYHRYLGRDHEAEARAAVDALVGQPSLFGGDVEPQGVVDQGSYGLLVTNLAERLNEYLEVNPHEFSIGDVATVYVLVGSEGTESGTVAAKWAAIIETEEVA